MNIGTFKSIDMDDMYIGTTSKELLPLKMKCIPDWVKEKAEKELKETEENKALSLSKLKEMISGNSNLCDIEFEDDFLVSFLRHRKYNVDKAYVHVQKCISYSKKHLDFLNLIPEEYITSRSAKRAFTLMPKRCPEGCLVFVLRQGRWDPDDLPHEFYDKVAMMLLMQLQRDPVTQINGVKLIIDCREVTVRHLSFWTPTTISNAYHFSTDWVALRWKGFHLISDSNVVKFAWLLLSKFSEKLQKRVHFHSDAAELLDYFPRCVLPVDYGGEVEDNDFTQEWLKSANKEHQQMSPGGMKNTL